MKKKILVLAITGLLTITLLFTGTKAKAQEQVYSQLPIIERQYDISILYKTSTGNLSTVKYDTTLKLDSNTYQFQDAQAWSLLQDIRNNFYSYYERMPLGFLNYDTSYYETISIENNSFSFGETQDTFTLQIRTPLYQGARTDIRIEISGEDPQLINTNRLYANIIINGYKETPYSTQALIMTQQLIYLDEEMNKTTINNGRLQIDENDNVIEDTPVKSTDIYYKVSQDYLNGWDAGFTDGTANGVNIAENDARQKWGIYYNGTWFTAKEFGDLKYNLGQSDEFDGLAIITTGIFGFITAFGNIEILPNLKIAYIIGIILVFGIISFITNKRKD